MDNYLYKDLRQLVEKFAYGECNTFVDAYKNGNYLKLVEFISTSDEHKNKFQNGLNFACKSGYSGIAKLFLDNGTKHLYSPFYEACKNRHIKICRMLLEYGATYESFLICGACEKDDLEMYQFLVENSNGHCKITESEWGLILTSSLKGKNIEIVKLVIKNINFNNKKDHSMILHHAWNSKHMDIIELVLKKINFKNFNKKNWDWVFHNISENTSYWNEGFAIACDLNSIEIVRILIKYGMNFNKWKREKYDANNKNHNNIVELIQAELTQKYIKRNVERKQRRKQKRDNFQIDDWMQKRLLFQRTH